MNYGRRSGRIYFTSHGSLLYNKPARLGTTREKTLKTMKRNITRASPVLFARRLHFLPQSYVSTNNSIWNVSDTCIKLDCGPSTARGVISLGACIDGRSAEAMAFSDFLGRPSPRTSSLGGLDTRDGLIGLRDLLICAWLGFSLDVFVGLPRRGLGVCFSVGSGECDIDWRFLGLSLITSAMAGSSGSCG